MARRVGSAVLAGCVLLPVFPPAAIGGAILGYGLPSMRAARAEKRRLAALAADLPDVVDLLVLAVGAGLTVGLAVSELAPVVAAVAPWVEPSYTIGAVSVTVTVVVEVAIVIASLTVPLVGA